MRRFKDLLKKFKLVYRIIFRFNRDFFDIKALRKKQTENKNYNKKKTFFMKTTTSNKLLYLM